MRKIYIEVPTTTDEVMMSIPYRNDELLGRIHVIFTESKEAKGSHCNSSSQRQ